MSQRGVQNEKSVFWTEWLRKYNTLKVIECNRGSIKGMLTPTKYWYLKKKQAFSSMTTVVLLTN